MNYAIQKGLGLIEVLITILVLGVGLLALVEFQSVTIYNEVLAQQYAQATNLAEQKIESFRNYTVQNTTSGQFAYQDIVSGTQSVSSNNTTYTISWIVSTNLAPDYKIVKLKVAWTDNTGVAQQISLTTIIAQTQPVNSGNIMLSPSSSGFTYPS